MITDFIRVRSPAGSWYKLIFQVSPEVEMSFTSFGNDSDEPVEGSASETQETENEVLAEETHDLSEVMPEMRYREVASDLEEGNQIFITLFHHYLHEFRSTYGKYSNLLF